MATRSVPAEDVGHPQFLLPRGDSKGTPPKDTNKMRTGISTSCPAAVTNERMLAAATDPAGIPPATLSRLALFLVATPWTSSDLTRGLLYPEERGANGAAEDVHLPHVISEIVVS